MGGKQRGFTKVSNDMLEKLYSSQFTAKQLRAILMVIRYSSGFHRDKASIPQNVYFEICGISSRDMGLENGPIGQLLEMNVLQSYTRGEKGTAKFWLNPEITEWKVPPAIQARRVNGKKESKKQQGQRLERYQSELKSLAVKKERPEKPP